MEDFCLSGQAGADLRLRFCTLRFYLLSFFPLSPDFPRPERHPSASGVIAPPMQWTHQERLNEGGGGASLSSESSWESPERQNCAAGSPLCKQTLG